MEKRSLVATEAGVKRAKAALKRQSLTQKALAYEIAIASWATVSKFFNNKPIDRHYFIEICEKLDLDWQDNDLIDSVENFTIEIGEKLSGVKESITEITSRLATQHGRGVLLIDTLDLVLEDV